MSVAWAVKHAHEASNVTRITSPLMAPTEHITLNTVNRHLAKLSAVTPNTPVCCALETTLAVFCTVKNCLWGLQHVLGVLEAFTMVTLSLLLLLQ